MSEFRDYLKEKLKNPEFKKEWDAIQDDLEAIRKEVEQNMKSYKDFGKRNIGASDYSSLILVGYDAKIGVSTHVLHFGVDGNYHAYIVDDPGAKIGDHYRKEYECDRWLKVYDDERCTAKFKAEKIEVYRAAEMGCIIRLIDAEEPEDFAEVDK